MPFQVLASSVRSTGKSLERASCDRILNVMLGPDRRLRDPSPEEIEALTLEGCARLVQSQLFTGNLEVSVVGDFDAAELETLVLQVRGRWSDVGGGRVLRVETISLTQFFGSESSPKPALFTALFTALQYLGTVAPKPHLRVQTLFPDSIFDLKTFKPSSSSSIPPPCSTWARWPPSLMSAKLYSLTRFLTSIFSKFAIFPAPQYLGTVAPKPEAQRLPEAPIQLVSPTDLESRHMIWHLADSDERACAYIAGPAPCR